MTLTLYAPFVSWGWFLYTYGPSIPLLADDQRISDAQAGLHGTAMAVGALVSAFLTPRAVVAWGRRTTIVGASLGLTVGIVGFLLGPSLPWTLAAVLVLAVAGNTMFSATQVGLALHHGPTASAVIAEGNGLGTAFGLFGPLAVGGCVALGWGWRPAVLLAPAVAVVAAVLVARLPATSSLTGTVRREPVATEPAVAVPDAPGAAGAPDLPGAAAVVGPPAPVGSAAPPAPVRLRHRPGPAAALFLVAIVAAGAVENATTYWSTALLMDRMSASASIATAAAAGLLAGMALMRFVVGPLSLQLSPTRLLAGAYLLFVVGWAVVWTAPSTAVAVLGLGIAGLGMGAQYPLAVSLLFAASPGHSDRAQGQSVIVGALAVAVAPFVLGALSDRVGIHSAFLVVPVFAVLGLVAALAGGRAMRRAVEPVAAVA